MRTEKQEQEHQKFIDTLLWLLKGSFIRQKLGTWSIDTYGSEIEVLVHGEYKLSYLQ